MRTVNSILASSPDNVKDVIIGHDLSPFMPAISFLRQLNREHGMQIIINDRLDGPEKLFPVLEGIMKMKHKYDRFERYIAGERVPSWGVLVQLIGATHKAHDNAEEA